MKAHSFRRRVPAWKFGFFASVAAVITIAASPAPAPLPYSTGISGYSGEFGFNCNSCHFGGTAPTVKLLGPKYVLLNSTRTYSFVVSGGQSIAAGLDVSVDAGTLKDTDPGTYLNSGEVTHNAPRNVDSNGDATWSFDFVAPAAAGTMTMYASGNSVNLSGTTTGDRARSTKLMIDVVDNLTSFSQFGVGLAGSGGFVPHLFGIDGPSIGPWSIEIADGLG